LAKLHVHNALGGVEPEHFCAKAKALALTNRARRRDAPGSAKAARNEQTGCLRMKGDPLGDVANKKSPKRAFFIGVGVCCANSMRRYYDSDCLFDFSSGVKSTTLFRPATLAA
jgi:hypothetical protein